MLLQSLRQPQTLLALEESGWDILARQARHAGLLARVAALLQQQAGLQAAPAAVQPLLRASLHHAEAQAREVRREVLHIRAALEGSPFPLVLLKGAAYVHMDLPSAAGRTFSDVDILVPRASLPRVELELGLAGWQNTHHDAYDQHYYRVWMHELPPLAHVVRGTTLDVHHAILPRHTGPGVQGDELMGASIPVPGATGVHVLAPTDMVLHAMAHLLISEEMHRGLRDLSDLDLLLKHFGTDPAFWPALVQRAGQLGLGRFLYHASHALVGLLGTPVPDTALADLQQHAPMAPGQPLMRAVWSRALGPLHPQARRPGTSAALALVFLRSHWLRMPAHLLARHLAHRLNPWNRPRHGGGPAAAPRAAPNPQRAPHAGEQDRT